MTVELKKQRNPEQVIILDIDYVTLNKLTESYLNTYWFPYKYS